VALISDGPGVRRRFLDILLSLNVVGYLSALQTFRQILGQRNAALKEGRGRGTVEIWDAGLVEAGARVIRDRRDWVARWADPFSTYYGTVSGASRARVRYMPGVALNGAKNEDEIAEAYRMALEENRDRDMRMGSTLAGPQRDDLLFTLPEGEVERDLREYGSGGQRRTAALGLRLVEAATIREARGQEPIVLMDDIFAELDPGRSERILGLMEEEETGQVFLTVPKESDIRLRRDSLPRWRIQGGRLEW
jgi:DNA replication and repair protein RecF